MAIYYKQSHSIKNLLSIFINDIALENKHPFFVPNIIVPNANTSKWLQLQFANLSAMSFHNNFLYIENVVFYFIKQALKIEIQELPIYLTIIKLMHFIEKNKNEKKLFFVKTYLKNATSPSTLYYLCQFLFYRYIKYSLHRTDILSLWENDQLYFYKTHWEKQEQIQKYIYMNFLYQETLNSLKRTIYHHSFLLNNLQWLEENLYNIPSKTLFFFPLSVLPNSYLNFILKISNVWDIYFYEVSILNKKVDNSNPIYQGFIKWKTLLKNKNIPTNNVIEENVSLQKKENNRLEVLKRNFFYDDVIEYQKMKNDFSFQIIQSYNIVEELKAIYYNIIFHLVNSKDNIPLEQIAILSPNPEEYLEIITEVFSSGAISLPIYKLENTKIQATDFNTAVDLCFRILHENLNKNDIIAILENKNIAQKIGVSQYESKIFLEWIEQLNVFFFKTTIF